MANKILPVAEALKQLYQSLGGDDPEVLELSTNTELIQEIAKVASSGGSGLPEVTEADDGKVLGVDDGEWKAVEPKSGILEITTEDGDITSVETTYAELEELFQSGIIPFFLKPTTYGDYVEYALYTCISVYDSPDDGMVQFWSHRDDTGLTFMENSGHLIPD